MIQIANLALGRTKEGKLLWEATARESLFLATLGNQSLQISHSPETSAEEETYSLSVLNRDGLELERLSATYRDGAYESLKEVFVLVRRQVLDVDKELEELANVLSAR
ncbi:MAG: hypothetical protein HY680_05250 [Chloroflexi bacterium]|nr:hypothetical protein [Chloroflexota bacterium]